MESEKSEPTPKTETNSVEHSVLPIIGDKLDGKTCYSRKYQFQSLYRE